MTPDDDVNHALDNVTQLDISLESESCDLPRRHHKSRFPLFKHPTLKDEFHTDAFYPSVISVQNHTYAQMFTGKDTGHW